MRHCRLVSGHIHRKRISTFDTFAQLEAKVALIMMQKQRNANQFFIASSHNKALGAQFAV